MPTPWYKNWFDTEYYHILYSHRNDDEARAFLDRLIARSGLSKSATIIDIGCGRGRHSVYLNQCGFDVTGIDLAAHSIEHARQFENEGLHFYVHDNRNVFQRGHFDAAFNLFTSFGYLETREALLDQLIHMADNLKPGGLFVLDYFNSHQVATCHFEDESIERNGLEFHIHKKIEGHQVIKTIRVKENDQTHDFEEKVHLITKAEFDELFRDAGLEIQATFGDYLLNPYNEDGSSRLIYLASKQA